MTWLQKIARPAGSFLGNKIIAFRSIGLDRAEEALMNGFKRNQFLTTTEERAVFYAHFKSGGSYPGVIFECALDSSRSQADMNDSTTEQQTVAYEAVQSASYEISDLLNRVNIDISAIDLEGFIGSQIGPDIGGYYDQHFGSPSLWMFVAKESKINPSEVQNIVSPGRYGGWITLDNRGVFGIDADISSEQLQYASFITPENITAAYLHTSLVSSLGWPWETYPNGGPVNGMNDHVSIIPAQIEDFILALENQFAICQNEDLCGYIEDLKSEILENTDYDSQLSNPVLMPGAVFDKLVESGDQGQMTEQLTVEDFEAQAGFVRFELPAERVRILYAIRKGNT